MALSNFSDLTAAVASWLDREDSDFAARVPDFITLAEQRLNYGGSGDSGLRVAEMEKAVTLTPDANGVLTLPADYLELRSLASTVPGVDPLSFSPIDNIQGQYPQGGIANDYSLTGTQVTTYPATTGPVRLTYYAKIPALTASSPTNWLMTKAPGVYLYGALIEAAPFESDDARMQSWLALYTSAIAGLKGTDIGARYSNATSRVRGPVV